VTDRLTAERNHEARTVAVVSALARSIDTRHPYTGAHQRRVAEVATALALELGCDEFTTQGIRLAATVHDVGTLAVPAEILTKPSKLTGGEVAVVQSHALVGYDILQDITSPWPIADMVLQHHERLDGSGYPHGLRGDEICMGARIIAVADVVEAMSAHRPYRSAPGLDVALSFVLEGRGSAFAADVVDACVLLGETGRLPGFDPPGPFINGGRQSPAELSPILEAL
jgi:HD-GYP domain-containing protein (c-di-GMP phosphodiesterase class II)